MRLRFLVLLLLAVAAPVRAQECTNADAAAADKASGSWRSWPSIFAAYKQYGYCDYGTTGDDFTNSIVHLLASRWRSLNQLQQLIVRESEFQAFVIHHISARADYDELQSVHHSATTSCPVSAAELCKDIAVAAKTAAVENYR